VQSLPAHPIDPTLDRMGLKRVTLAHLKGEAHKFAATLICRTLSPGSDTRPLMVAIDVFLWKDGELVRMELANVNMPPTLKSMFEAIIAQGLEGIPPRALSLTPCLHVPWHWDSLCLSLAWEEETCSPRIFVML